MADPNDKGSGGTDPNAGGNPGDKDPKNDDTVKYETHRKLLDEKKRVQQERDDLQKKLKEIEDEKVVKEKADLEKKGEVQKLLELERADKKKVQDEFDKVKGQLARGAKLRSVLDKINGQVDEAYWGLVDVDDVVIDEKSGLPDETSVAAAVAKFEKTYAKVISKGNGTNLPNDAARGGKTLAYDEWLKLPLKEQKVRMKEVVDSDQ